MEKLHKSEDSVLKFPVLCHFYKQSGSGKLLFLFSVSKKRFPKSVDRNRIKRLMREAIRLQKNKILMSESHDLIIGLTFLSDSITNYQIIYNSVSTIINKINSTKH